MEVQRTLVKSPPELWAEVSDVEALTRHLASFGEIAITRLEPERKVAWEGEHARGTVELTASGWGTKVTISAEAITDAHPGDDPAAATAAGAGPDGHGAAAHADAALDAEPMQITAEQAVVELAAATLEPTMRNRWGWLRFWRRRAETPAPPTPGPGPGPPAPPAPDPAPPTPAPTPGPPDPPSPTPPQIEAVLAEALERLGQAHHRPFSRS